MNVLIEQNTKYGLVVSSRVVAKELGKRHDNVVRDLEKILTASNLRRLIILHTYTDSKNRTYKEYLLTKVGFTLYMFNIQGYIDFKMAYINKFNEMEKTLAEQKKIPTKVPVSFEHTIASTFGGTPVMEIKLLSQITGITHNAILYRAKQVGAITLTKKNLREYKIENGEEKLPYPKLIILFKEHVINICKYYGVYERVKDIIENYFKGNNRIAYKQEEERDVLGRTYADRVESTKRMIDMLTKKIDGKLVEIKDICDEIKSYRDHIHSYSTQI